MFVWTENYGPNLTQLYSWLLGSPMGGWSRNTAVHHVTRRTSRSPGRSRTGRMKTKGTSSWATERRKQDYTFAGIYGLEAFGIFSCVSSSTSQKVALIEAHMRTTLSLTMSLMSSRSSSRFSPAPGGLSLGLAVALLTSNITLPLHSGARKGVRHTLDFF